MKIKDTLPLIFLLLFCLAAGSSAQDRTVALTNARLVPVSGPHIENGTLIIQNGIIADLGADVRVPEGAQVIDCSGLCVYPGMIESASTLGLYEIGSVAATVDVSETGDYNPHIKAAVAVNPHSVHIPVTRVNGVTSAVAIPGGGIISGQAALLNLHGWTADEMVLKAPAALVINFPRAPSPRGRGGREQTAEQKARAKEQTAKQTRGLNEILDRARRYAARQEAHALNPAGIAPRVDPVLESLVPAVKKELLVLIAVDAERDILNAIRFVNKQDLKAAFLGCAEGWKTADSLAAAGVPVLTGPVLRSPGPKDPYDAHYANAGVMHAAGVTLAFVTRGAADVRSLPYHAGTAAAYGLDKEEALKAVTINPARIFGVADRIGSLEKGKLANVVVTDGDILEMKTHIRYLFIAGRRVPLESKHTELYETFKAR